MARRPQTERQRQLAEVLAELKAEKLVLKQQQRRVAAVRSRLAQLSSCDFCGAKTLPTGCDLQLCPACSAEQREQKRMALLARNGYGPDGKRLAAA
jgi:hypothetical protein